MEIYLEPHLAQPQLILVSHQPVAEALAGLGRAVGFAVTVLGVDARPDRFPGAQRVLPDLQFDALAVTPNSYIVVASHGNYDEDALEWALGTEAAYVALIASPRRAEAVRAYLRESGLTEAQLARLKSPAGLDLGAVTPEEIALSVLAEIVQARRRGTRDEGRREVSEEREVSPITHPRPETEPETRTTHHDPHPPEAHEQMSHAHHDHATHAPQHTEHEATDPVCGMIVEIAGARYTADYAGQTYFFCCPACRRLFQKDPAQYAPA